MMQLRRGLFEAVINQSGGAAPPSPVPAPTPTAYYKFDETSTGASPVTRADSIGSNNLTDTNNVVSVAGKSGNAAHLQSASSQKLEAASNAALQSGDIDFYFDVWIYPTALASLRYFAQKWANDNAKKEWIIRGAGALSLFWYNNASDANVNAASWRQLQLNTWNNVQMWRSKARNMAFLSIDGRLLVIPGATGGNSGTAPLTYGVSSFNANYMDGYLDESGIWKTGFTPAFRATRALGGTYPFNITETCSLVVVDGNSITSPDKTYGEVLRALLVAGGEYWEIANVAVSGQTTTQMLSDQATQVTPIYEAGYTKAVLVGFEGTNDLKLGATAAQAYQNLVDYYTAGQAAGYSVVAKTILPRNDAGLPGDFEASRQTVNTNIRANWQNYADALVDADDTEELGTVNATYYADGVHLTAAGIAFMAGLDKAAIDALSA